MVETHYRYAEVEFKPIWFAQQIVWFAIHSNRSKLSATSLPQMLNRPI